MIYLFLLVKYTNEHKSSTYFNMNTKSKLLHKQHNVEIQNDLTVKNNIDCSGNVIIDGDLIVDTNVLYVNTTSNRVGINKAPGVAAQLEINGSMDLTGSILFTSSSSGIEMQTSNADLNISTLGTGVLKFNDNSASTGDIDFNNGKIYLDASTSRIGINNSSPADLLNVNGVSGDFAVIRIDQIGTSQFTGVGFSRAGTEKNFIGMPNSSDDLLLRRNATTDDFIVHNSLGDCEIRLRLGIGTQANASYQLELSGNGAHKLTDAVWTFTSDERLKESVVNADLDQCYSDIKSLSLKYFKWIDSFITNNEITDTHKLGFIADEVELIIPKAVTTNDKYKKEEIVTNNGTEENPDISITYQDTTELDYRHGFNELKSLNVDQLIMSLFGCVMKLQEKVEALEAI